MYGSRADAINKSLLHESEVAAYLSNNKKGARGTTRKSNYSGVLVAKGYSSSNIISSGRTVFSSEYKSIIAPYGLFINQVYNFDYRDVSINITLPSGAMPIVFDYAPTDKIGFATGSDGRGANYSYNSRSSVLTITTRVQYFKSNQVGQFVGVYYPTSVNALEFKYGYLY